MSTDFIWQNNEEDCICCCLAVAEIFHEYLSHLFRDVTLQRKFKKIIKIACIANENPWSYKDVYINNSSNSLVLPIKSTNTPNYLSFLLALRSDWGLAWLQIESEPNGLFLVF